MSNIAVIHSIDRQAAGEFLPVPFQAGSAEYGCKRSKTNQGYLYKYSLTFRMVGLTGDNEAELAAIAGSRCVRIRDVNGVEISIGNQHIALVVTWDDMIDGTPGGFRGTAVKIEWSTARRANIQSFI